MKLQKAHERKLLQEAKRKIKSDSKMAQKCDTEEETIDMKKMKAYIRACDLKNDRVRNLKSRRETYEKFRDIALLNQKIQRDANCRKLQSRMERAQAKRSEVLKSKVEKAVKFQPDVRSISVQNPRPSSSLVIVHTEDGGYNKYRVWL